MYVWCPRHDMYNAGCVVAMIDFFKDVLRR